MPSALTSTETPSTGRRHGKARASLPSIRLSHRVASIKITSPPAAIPTMPTLGGVRPRLRQRSMMPSPATTTMHNASEPAIRRASERARRNRIDDDEPHPVDTAGGFPSFASRRATECCWALSPPRLKSHNKPFPNRTSSFHNNQSNTRNKIRPTTINTIRSTISSLPPDINCKAKSPICEIRDDINDFSERY